MPSLYTDSVREARYAKLRAEKNRLEKIYNILGWIALITMGGGLIMAALSAFLVGIFLNPMEIVKFVPEAGQVFCVFAALYKREPKFTELMMLVFIACGVVGALLSGASSNAMNVSFVLNFAFIFLIVCLIYSFRWQKLAKEEGFPHFDITYEERQKRMQLQEEQSRNRAIRSGVRVAATEQTSEMGDILDAGFDAPVLASHLTGTHDRSKNAVGGMKRPAAYTAGEMDELAEDGAPPQSAEMEELRSALDITV